MKIAQVMPMQIFHLPLLAAWKPSAREQIALAQEKIGAMVFQIPSTNEISWLTAIVALCACPTPQPIATERNLTWISATWQKWASLTAAGKWGKMCSRLPPPLILQPGKANVKNISIRSPGFCSLHWVSPCNLTSYSNRQHQSCTWFFPKDILLGIILGCSQIPSRAPVSLKTIFFSVINETSFNKK